MTDKDKIIKIFNEKVKGKTPDTTLANQRHDGKNGHWLETQMGITHNADNKPDLFGYEMKNKTSSGKISFGDWSADEYIFVADSKINTINKNFYFWRESFLKTFGKPNAEKNGRHSWSGSPCSTLYGQNTAFGQGFSIDFNGDVLIIYNYSKDTRPNKNSIVPLNMQIDNLILAKWYKESLKNKLESKFNQNGWFTVSTDKSGKYEKIHFGDPMNYNSWISLFKNKKVFFDSGMFDDKENTRLYSMWRATTGVWHSLIKESF